MTKILRKNQRAKAESGFSLVELLAVIAVIAIMAIAVVPAFNAIKGASDLTKEAFNIADALEQARAYAMANNTYVFVGFAERDGLDSSQPGIGRIYMVVMGSKDGTRSFGANNSNLVALSKLRRMDNLHLEDSLPNSGAMSRPGVENAFRVANATFGAGSSFESFGYTFAKIIQFDPQGKAGIPSQTNLLPQWMEIGLVAAKGATALGTQNCSALILDGVTGSTKIYRP
jgi:prepilin-type N-terminal cleavage/methylation domain-containing protein